MSRRSLSRREEEGGGSLCLDVSDAAGVPGVETGLFRNGSVGHGCVGGIFAGRNCGAFCGGFFRRHCGVVVEIGGVEVFVVWLVADAQTSGRK